MESYIFKAHVDTGFRFDPNYHENYNQRVAAGKLFTRMLRGTIVSIKVNKLPGS